MQWQQKIHDSNSDNGIYNILNLFRSYCRCY